LQPQFTGKGDLGGSPLCNQKWAKWLTFRLSNTA
jgi:hypothetical protein